MPRFLFEASYTVEGLKGLRRQGGSGRREAVARAAQSVGGRLEHFYFAFGDHDAFAVADLPDNESAAAFALAVSEAGGASVRTVVLLTPEEVDAAAKHSVEYRPPMEWEARHFVSGAEQDLDGLPGVHRLVAGRCLVQRELEVEHLAGVDPPVPDQVDELGQEPADGGGAAVQVDA